MAVLTDASFFSGVGGLDLGLERAGWRTVSFSEIEPYASAVLAQRWPGVPNLGDIVRLAEGLGAQRDDEPARSLAVTFGESSASRALLWSGGFPCQDLSVAGKRRGMGEGTRSGLAYAFLGLVERYRPPAILLENVPGLLSSHGGRDMAALLGAMVELGYGVAYRILDARYFGVPQRRRRVFIVGLRSGDDDPDGRVAALRAASVLAVGTRCRRHPATGHETGEEPADRTDDGADIVGTVPAGLGHHGNGGHSSQAVAAGHVIAQALTSRQERNNHLGDQQYVVGPAPDPGGVRATDGLAGRLDDRGGLAATLNSGGNDGGFRTEPGEHLVAFVKHSRYGEHGDPRRPDGDDAETWGPADLSGVLDSIGHTPRTATAVIGASGMTDDPLLPLGLDSHRYRCCGNGVVAPVAEWLGQRLAEALA